jgi:hypothetical protein
MKTISILALGLFPFALAIDQPKRQCANFLKINAPQKQERGRFRRNPQWNWGGMSSGDDSTTGSPVTSDPTTVVTTTTKADTASTATSAVNTPGPTTPVKAATEPSDTTTDITVAQDENKAIIVMLDATGSMQDIGGKGKGRDLVIRKMEMFRNMLNKKVQKDRVHDQPLTFVTFHESASWQSYDSINQWPTISRKNYNPGYQTNLYDSMGCVLSEYSSRHPDQEVSVYLISDGIHKLGPRKRANVAYQENEINQMVEDLRSRSNWNFHFYGATEDDKKDALKKQAINLGFRAAEIAVFDFNGRQFGSLLKSMLSTMVENGKEGDKAEVPACEKCPRGRAGRVCRVRKQNMIGLGLCVNKYVPSG